MTAGLKLWLLSAALVALCGAAYGQHADSDPVPPSHPGIVVTPGTVIPYQPSALGVDVLGVRPADPAPVPLPEQCGQLPTMVEVARCLHANAIIWAVQSDPDSVDIWQRCSTELFASHADQGRITKAEYWSFAAALVKGCAEEADQRRARRLEERRILAQERAAAAAELAAKVEAQKLCLRLTGRLCPVPSK